jgi:hypothetical protein
LIAGELLRCAVMAKATFNKGAIHAAFGQKVAGIYGWSSEGARPDARLVFYFRMLQDAGAFKPGAHLVDLGCGLSAPSPAP